MYHFSASGLRPMRARTCCSQNVYQLRATHMQNPIRKLAAQATSLEAACPSAAFEENENVFACSELTELFN
jgi:hypothetical protein